MKTILLILLSIQLGIFSQTFTDIGANIDGGGSAWGDYDLDGDLDLLSGSNIYRNDNGIFNLAQTISSKENSIEPASWGDFDDDGDLDILIGEKIFRNNSGTFIFYKEFDFYPYDPAEWPLVSSTCKTCWVDYNNDGLLDVYLTCEYTFKPDPVYDPDFTATENNIDLYKNNGYSFISVSSYPGSGYHPAFSWGDFDNDGDSDFLTRNGLYIYNGSWFEGPDDVGISNLPTVSFTCGDYDNDSDLDILATDTESTKIYMNDSCTFTDINSGLSAGTINSKGIWGDFDSDGDLDILLSDSDSGAKLYRNDDSLFIDTAVSLTLGNTCSWGDFDNDGDLDIAGGTRIYRNDTIIKKIDILKSSNIPPSPPNNLLTIVESASATFQWNKSTDPETPQDGLSYNLYIGTQPGSCDIMSPKSDLITGFRKIVSMGNAQLNQSWSIKDLEPGTYYWSVQSIDNCFSGSEFAPEQSFIINYPTALEASNITFEGFTALWNSVLNAEGYLIDLSTDPDFTNFVGEYENYILPNDTSYTFTGLLNDTDYYYRLKSFEGSIESDYSNTISVKTLSYPFEDINIGLPEVTYSSSDWGDFDNDGDLDILLTGSSYSGIISEIYRNDSGVFTDLNAGIIGVSDSSVGWCDYDNDGDLDILLTGNSSIGYISKIYRNDSGVFTDINAGLIGVRYSSVTWGDYDNDGDWDILLTGKSSSGNYISKTYNNESGTFTDINAGLQGVAWSSVAWGDYDNDCDLDILLTGYSSSGKISKIYRNDSGIFADINAELQEITSGSAEWGDYDNDGDLDILYAGAIESINIYALGVLINNNGVFSESAYWESDYPGSGSRATWGDFDNDGDLDILFSCEEKNVYIYRNDAGVFYKSDLGLKGAGYGSISWGDYDNDGDLDILLTGKSSSGNYISKIYNNSLSDASWSSPNSFPAAPSNLYALQKQDSINFTWDKATDAETPQDGLSYNLYIGTQPGTCDIMSPKSDITTGYRKSISIGNTQLNQSWSIIDLEPGTYYWSVQAVDNCFAGSEFATEQMITVTGIEDHTIPHATELFQNYPNPFNPITEIKYSLSKDAHVKLTIFDIVGHEVASLVDQNQGHGYHKATFNAENLTSGMYFYQLKVDDNVISSKKMMMIK